ncbi:MAG: inositol monophosphatase family protein [Eubacteriales bacterium]|nr:inositol monophosphatase family protein [Eubacteriales bacterium]
MLIDAIQQVVRECGQVILQADRTQAETQTKCGRSNDLVTKYDKAVQELLREKLLKFAPQAHFVGEEEDVHESIAKGDAFIVDPIDGTTNFVHDYKNSAISVAMTRDGKQEIGVIYNPYLDEMFYAQRGCGAFCNGMPIHVSDRPLAQGLTIFGSAAYYHELVDESFRLLRKCFDRSMDIRRSGSAAIDLCSIAAGRAELYFELLLQPWDYAAGSLIVTEAGGSCTRVDGGAIDLTKGCSILAVGSQVDPAFMRE